MYRAFCDKANKPRLDHLFSLLFEKTLAKPPGETDEVSHLNKLSDLVPGVQWLNLPLSVEVSGGDSLKSENGLTYMLLHNIIVFLNCRSEVDFTSSVFCSSPIKFDWAILRLSRSYSDTCHILLLEL